MSRLVDNLITLRLLRLFTIDIEETAAYKLGIVNEKGEQLKQMRDLKTRDEEAAYTLLHRLVFRLRGLFERIPFVSSRLANYAAALLLIKEKIVKEEEFFESDNVLLEKIEHVKHRPGYMLAEQTVSEWMKQWEDAAVNSTGPAVAGTGDDNTVIPVKKRKRKTGMFTVTPDVFRRFSKGKRKFERWSKYLNTEDEAENKIYIFAQKNPSGMIILKNSETGETKAIRFNRNGGGNWRNIQRRTSLKEWIDDTSD